MMIKEFIQSGKIKSLALGISKAETHSLLGEAGASTDHLKGTEIWKYGGLEITFSNDVVCFIGLYFDDGATHLPESLAASREAYFEESRLEDIKNFLLTNEIEFSIDARLTFDDQVCLRATKSNVGIYFAQNELQSMQVGTC